MKLAVIVAEPKEGVGGVQHFRVLEFWRMLLEPLAIVGWHEGAARPARVHVTPAE